MKPAFLIFFSIIFGSSLAFAAIYTLWQDVVESNPAMFAVGLMSIIVIGLCGMLSSIHGYATVEKRA